MALITLQHDGERGFEVSVDGESQGIVIEAPANEGDDVRGWFAKKLCDNPEAQASLGILSSDEVEIEVL